jgi:hypothetical protein
MTQRLKFLSVVVVVCCATMMFGQAKSESAKLPAYTAVQPAGEGTPAAIKAMAASSTLPLWTFNVKSSRDGNNYTGVMVGTNPFSGGDGQTPVTTQIVPLIIVTHKVGVSLNSKGILSTVLGKTVFDPLAADNSCLSAPNNVPLTLVQQSPMIQSATFTMGGTTVGDTQYIDAFQRANFWQQIGPDYHVTLAPVQTLSPIVVDIPAGTGLAISPSVFGNCGPLGIVNYFSFSQLLNNSLLPALRSQGVNPSTFPIFLMYNVVMSIGRPTNLNQCCILGFHGAHSKGVSTPAQTFSPLDFDTTGLFGPGISDTAIMAHEVGEWLDDPLGNNPTPAWGHTGQVGGCQGNLEVGDPLTGTGIPPVTMSNGFTYHLQELAFFSWFYGAPSVGVNGWFSDNGTFTTDAGPPCQ